MSKPDDAWEKIEEEFNFVKQLNNCKLFKISSDEVKKWANEEPRLVTKFDCSAQLPNIFKANNISVMSTARKEYTLVPSNLYDSLPTNEIKIENIEINNSFASIDFFQINSEALAINVASICGIFENFLGGENYYQTISGRMGSSEFDFSFLDNNNERQYVEVTNPQIEIDGSLENEDEFVLIEAKKKEFSDILTRQVYYPYRHFLNIFHQRKSLKPIRNIYMIYDDKKRVFTLHECVFTDYKQIDSMIITKTKKYQLCNSLFSKNNLISIVKNGNIYDNNIYEIPPQADSPLKIQKIISLCVSYKKSSIIKEEFVDFFDVDARQGDYYLAFCKFYNMIEEYSEENELLVNVKIDTKNISSEIVRCLAQDFYINDILNKLLIENTTINDKQLIDKFQKTYTQKNGKLYAFDTAERRVQTIKKMIFLILDWCNIEYIYDNKTISIK